MLFATQVLGIHRLASACDVADVAPAHSEVNHTTVTQKFFSTGVNNMMSRAVELKGASYFPVLTRFVKD